MPEWTEEDRALAEAQGRLGPPDAPEEDSEGLPVDDAPTDPALERYALEE